MILVRQHDLMQGNWCAKLRVLATSSAGSSGRCLAGGRPAADLPDQKTEVQKSARQILLRSQLKKSSTEAVSEKLVGEKKLRRGPASKITISPGSPGGGGALTFPLRRASGADLDYIWLLGSR